MTSHKVKERAMLLRQYFDFDWTQSGRRNNIISELQLDEDMKTEELAEKITDDQLKLIFRSCSPWSERNFYGEFYTVTKCKLKLQGSWEVVRQKTWQVLRLWGREAFSLLRALLILGTASFPELCEKASEIFGSRIYPTRMISDLARKWGLVIDVGTGRYSAWTIPEETRIPINEVLDSCGLKGLPKFSTALARDEYQSVQTSDREYENYVNALVENRLEETLEFAKNMSSVYLEKHMKELFGEILFFDPLLALTQQYSLANVPIVNKDGRISMYTGYNLALFGEPGTGKSFAVDDLIRGNPRQNVPPHGLPGRNRYCGGMTAARFIRIGEAYDGRRFNFIVPELNSWFKYSGMVEPLKLAMEQREIKYEIKDEVVGPYKFSSFFSVNYNTRVSPSGYRVTISDPNFNAIEDRMLCRLSSLTKKRYDAIAESQRRIMLGEVDLQDAAAKIRDHLMLTNASQVGYPKIPDNIVAKPILLTEDVFQKFSHTRKHILTKFDNIVPFSPRLEARAIRLCCALSSIESLRITKEKIPISNHALQLSLKFYEEECQTRGLALSSR